MTYITMETIRGVNGSNEVLEAGSPISIEGLPRLGYVRAQLAWDVMLADGTIAPVGATSAQGGPSAIASAGGAADQVFEPAPGESALAYAERVAPALRARRAGHAAAGGAPGSWQIGPPTAGYRPPNPEQELATALAASAAFDARKKAEAATASPAAPSPTRAPAPPPDPSRAWVRP